MPIMRKKHTLDHKYTKKYGDEFRKIMGIPYLMMGRNSTTLLTRVNNVRLHTVTSEIS